MDLDPFAPAVELAAALARKDVGSVELLDAYLARVEKFDPAINAVVALDADRAREEARRADDELARGESRGLLHGLPMTIKDAFETEGLVTTSGAPELANHVPERDAEPVARLKAAGAIVFGKTNLPLYAGDLQTYNEVYGTTNNPWDVTRGPGGSSGGSAAALAAGLTGFELGSDIGGSIRNPAHFCGVYGMKPSYGTVAGRGHIPGPPGSLSEADVGVFGPMGRSVADLVLGMDVLAGPPPDRAVAWRLEFPPARGSSVGEYRMAAWLDDPFSPVDTAMGDVLAAAVASLRAAGAAIDEDARPGVSLAQLGGLWEQLVITVTGAGLPEPMFDAACAVEATPVEEGEPSMMRFGRAVAMRHRTWMRLNEKRNQFRAAFDAFFRGHDVLLAPVTQSAAFPHNQEVDFFSRSTAVNGEQRPYIEQIMWCGAFGVVYLPVAVVPVGFTSGGLPVGIQIVGPYLEDRTVLDVAARFEEILGGFRAPPL